MKIKLFISILIFIIYISVGIFGLFQSIHINETPMPNCPYTENNYSLCENSLDHINGWRQFSNVIVTSLFIFLILIFGIILYFFGLQNLLNKKLFLFYKWKYYLNNKKLYSYRRKIIKWLSLFENSPSFS